MPSIAERKRRRKQSAVLRQKRLSLLAELESLKEKLCDKCKKPGPDARLAHVTCGCPAATRTREIGQELSKSINVRREIEVSAKEVKKVAKKNNSTEMTEKAVNAMRENGMTFTEIAKEFGVSATTLSTRRQNWELERVREKHKEGKNLVDPVEAKPVVKADEKKGDEISSFPTLQTNYEEEINGLKSTLAEKDEFIQKQWKTIDKLTAERDELIKKNESSGSLQDEIKDERKLLAILLERETARLKNLVEVG